MTKPRENVFWPSNYPRVCSSSSNSCHINLKSFLAFSVVCLQTSFSVIFFTCAISLHDMVILNGIFRTYVNRKVHANKILFPSRQPLNYSLYISSFTVVILELIYELYNNDLWHLGLLKVIAEKSAAHANRLLSQRLDPVIVLLLKTLQKNALR